MMRYERIRIIVWAINICLALLTFSLSIYFIVFEVVYKEKSQAKKFVFKGASNNKNEPLLAQLSPTWQLIVGVVPEKKSPASGSQPVKQKPVTPSLTGMEQELRLIACACDTDPTKNYCVLEDLRTKKQMLVGEGYIIDRLAARVVSINSQKIQLLYQGKMHELEKRTADDNLANRQAKENNQSQELKWIERVFNSAELEDTEEGVKIKEPGELRGTGLLSGDILFSLDGTLVYQKQTLMNAFKQTSSLPFWSLVLKRNNENISLVILKKRRQ